jgi:hypothetical protein
MTGVDAALVGSAKVGLEMTQTSWEGEVSDQGTKRHGRQTEVPQEQKQSGIKLRPHPRSLIKPVLVCRRPWT